MIRPVILSSPEKLAFLLTIFCAGGSVTTSSPGCSVGGDCGTPLGWRCPGDPGSALGPGGATATPWLGGGVFCGITVVPGGGAKGCDCTAPGGGAPCPGGNGRLGVGNSRPCGSSGTSSSSSAGPLPRGMLLGGRGAGSEKMLPICARAGGASAIVVAARTAAKPVRTMVRNISRGFKKGESG